MTNNKTLIALVYISISIVFIILGIVLFRTYQKKGSGAVYDTEKPKIQKTEAPTGLLTLALPADQKIYKVGDEIKVIVYGTSYNSTVEGYDAVIQLQSSALSFDSARSLSQSFDMFETVKEGIINVTGVKKQSMSDLLVLEKTPLVELTFKAVRPGKAELTFNFTRGSTRDSNLVASDNKDILNTVENATVFVGDEITLQKGQKRFLDEEISLTLQETEVGSPDCSDCIDSATINVTKGIATETIKFKVGGIAGFADIEAEAFGYKLEFVGVKEESVTVGISKE